MSCGVLRERITCHARAEARRAPKRQPARGRRRTWRTRYRKTARMGDRREPTTAFPFRYRRLETRHLRPPGEPPHHRRHRRRDERRHSQRRRKTRGEEPTRSARRRPRARSADCRARSAVSVGGRPGSDAALKGRARRRCRGSQGAAGRRATGRGYRRVSSRLHRSRFDEYAEADLRASRVSSS
ncbi:hypothetical protein QFZ94_000643 [Paraburkholderia sp. JPY465]